MFRLIYERQAMVLVAISMAACGSLPVDADNANGQCNGPTVSIGLSTDHAEIDGGQKVAVTIRGTGPDCSPLGERDPFRLSVSAGKLVEADRTAMGTTIETSFHSDGTSNLYFFCPANPITIRLDVKTRYSTAEKLLHCDKPSYVGLMLSIGSTALSYGVSTNIDVTITDTTSSGAPNPLSRTIVLTQSPVGGSFSGADIPPGAYRPSVETVLNGGVGTVRLEYTAGTSSFETSITACIKETLKCATISGISIQNGRIVELTVEPSTVRFGEIALLVANVRTSGIAAPGVRVRFEMTNLAGVLFTPTASLYTPTASNVDVTATTDAHGDARAWFTAGQGPYLSTTVKASIVNGIAPEYDAENIVISP